MTLNLRETAAARVLIVEDEYLLAADLADLLVNHGYSVVGPAADLDDALDLAREASIDVGILDVHIRGGYSDLVAEALAQRGCPFLFITGYGPRDLPRGCGSTPVLTKPVTHARLLECLGELVKSGSGD